MNTDTNLIDVRTFILFIATWLWLPAVMADSLDDFFNGLTTYRAQFEQTTRDQYGQVVQEARGELQLARPGKFRWDYREPYEQLVLGDGKKLWTYDADLEQATVKPQSEVLSGSPAELLSQAVSPRQLFTVTAGRAEGPLQHYELTPRDTETSGYSRIGMTFLKQELLSMELVDGFGQITEIRFLHPQHNVDIPASTFAFVLPKGADLIGQAQP